MVLLHYIILLNYILVDLVDYLLSIVFIFSIYFHFRSSVTFAFTFQILADLVLHLLFHLVFALLRLLSFLLLFFPLDFLSQKCRVKTNNSIDCSPQDVYGKVLM